MKLCIIFTYVLMKTMFSAAQISRVNVVMHTNYKGSFRINIHFILVRIY